MNLGDRNDNQQGGASIAKVDSASSMKKKGGGGVSKNKSRIGGHRQ